MPTQPQATAAPPVEALLGVVFATLAFAAHAYLAASHEGAEGTDLGAAELAIDLAGKTFERLEPRLSTEERAAMASMLTDLRMTFVRKRGL